METIKRILSKMSNISKPQKKFLTLLFSTIMVLRGRVNFRNLSRYSDLSEISFLRNFRKSFDFKEFNLMLIQETIPLHHKKIAALDCSYVPKSGKKSYGIDNFWSGQAGRAKKGQEISLLSIVDLDYNSSYSLSVEQTPSSLEIGEKEENRIDFYLKQLKKNQSSLQQLSIEHIAVDGF